MLSVDYSNKLSTTVQRLNLQFLYFPALPCVYKVYTGVVASLCRFIQSSGHMDVDRATNVSKMS